MVKRYLVGPVIKLDFLLSYLFLKLFTLKFGYAVKIYIKPEI